MTESLAQRCARELRERKATIDRLTEANERLRADNQRVWQSREEWKEKHRGRETELSVLRRSVKRLTADRNKWRHQARKRGESLYNYRRYRDRPRGEGKAEWHNIHLTERDLKRILEMTPK